MDEKSTVAQQFPFEFSEQHTNLTQESFHSADSDGYGTI